MNTWLDFDWRDWVAIDELDESQWTILGSGVYAIGAGLRNGNSVPIHRACGCDPDGIIYFGEGTLSLRLSYLLQMTNDATSEHGYFTTNLFSHMNLDRIFDRKYLKIRWCEVENSKVAESQMIDAYINEFGELPPGNSQTALSYFK